MKTENVSAVPFEAKQRFLNKNQLKLVREISKKMCNQSAITYKENTFTANYIDAVKFGKFVLYSDTFLKNKNENSNYGKVGKTQVEFNNKKISIDNETGEITKIEKPWYSSTRHILKQMSSYLKAVNFNFNNDDMVTKSKPSIHGFTQKGLERIMSGDIAIDNEDGEINV